MARSPPDQIFETMDELARTLNKPGMKPAEKLAQAKVAARAKDEAHYMAGGKAKKKVARLRRPTDLNSRFPHRGMGTHIPVEVHGARRAGGVRRVRRPDHFQPPQCILCAHLTSAPTYNKRCDLDALQRTQPGPSARPVQRKEYAARLKALKDELLDIHETAVLSLAEVRAP